MGPLFIDIGRQIQAALYGHADVAEDNIRAFLINNADGFYGVFRQVELVNGKAGALQHTPDFLPQQLLVINNQYGQECSPFVCFSGRAPVVSLGRRTVTLDPFPCKFWIFRP